MGYRGICHASLVLSVYIRRKYKWHVPRYPTRKHCINTLSHVSGEESNTTKCARLHVYLSKNLILSSEIWNTSKKWSEINQKICFLTQSTQMKKIYRCPRISKFLGIYICLYIYHNIYAYIYIYHNLKVISKEICEIF